MLRAELKENRFSNEAALVRALLTVIRRETPEDFAICREFSGGVGVADVVLYRRRSESTRAIELLSQMNPRLAPLAAPNVATQVSSVQAMARLLGTSIASARKTVRDLQRLGAISNVSGKMSMSAISRAPFVDIVAIEAKLSNWRVALTQAYRNRQFASQSWVVLDHNQFRVTDANEKHFRNAGVGLATLEKGPVLYVRLQANEGLALSSTKYWQAQALLARSNSHN